MAICIHCQEEIKDGATVCKICHKLQSRFRSEIAFWSGIVGLLALLGSAYAFVSASTDKWRAQFFGVDFSIINLSNFKSLELVNTSEYDFFVRSIEFKLPDEQTGLSTVVSEFAKSGERLKFDLGEAFVKQTTGAYGTIFSPCSYGGHFLDTDEDVKETVQKNALGKDFTTHLPELIAKESSDYQFFKSKRQDGRLELSCSATLTYQVLGGRNIEHEVPCVSIMHHRIKPTASCLARLETKGVGTSGTTK